MSMRALRSKMRGVLVLLSLMWLQRGEALPARPYRRTEFASQDDAARSAPGDRVGWMTARLDHFSADTRTFQQRFFINASLYKPGGPVFLCVGGEGPPMTEAVVVSGEVKAGQRGASPLLVSTVVPDSLSVCMYVCSCTAP